MTMYLIDENFDSNTLIFIWLQQKRMPRVIKKISILLTCIGQKGREIYETFTLELGDEMKSAPLLHKFSEYCNPRKNTTILCHSFFTHRQQEGQNFHNFVTELKNLSSKYEFDNLQDSRIINMIVCSTRDNSFHERLPWECDLTLSKAITAGYAAEETQHAHKILRSLIKFDKIFKSKLKSSHNSRNQNIGDFIIKFKFCDSSHPQGKCPANGKAWYVCNEKNGHYWIEQQAMTIHDHP